MESTLTTAKINRSRSRFQVKAFATGMLSSFGHNPTFNVRDFSGEIRYDPSDPQSASLQLLIRADSLELADDVSPKDRQELMKTMQEQVLHVSSFPEIRFEGSKATANKLYEGTYRIALEGTLTLHGVSRPQTVEANVTAAGNQIRAGGEATFRQTEFDIRLVSVAAGSLKIKDEVKIVFDIVAQT